MVNWDKRINFFQNLIEKSELDINDSFLIGEKEFLKNKLNELLVKIDFEENKILNDEIKNFDQFPLYFKYLVGRLFFETNGQLLIEDYYQIYQFENFNDRINYILNELKMPLLFSDIDLCLKNNVGKDYIFNYLIPFYFLNPWYFPLFNTKIPLYEFTEIFNKRFKFLLGVD